MYKILIADDEYLERKVIRYYLNKFYEDQIEIAAEVSDGKKAFSQALSKDVDIVLMDIQMPRMNGLKAAEKIKNEKAEIEIIILTAHNEFDNTQKSDQIGAADYLVKPYSELEFCRVIDKILLKIKEKKK
jgi:YesN/AraC family two-component response regulator